MKVNKVVKEVETVMIGAYARTILDVVVRALALADGLGAVAVRGLLLALRPERAVTAHLHKYVFKKLLVLLITVS